MHLIASIADIVLHLDSYLQVVVTQYGAWAYALLFIVVFCETGLVVTPFLPGDSLLFMLGTLAAAGLFRLGPSVALLATAAILGDTANYHIGKYIGPRAFNKDSGRIFRKDNLERAATFYERWGGAAVILGRFMPIIRTFVPFVAGIGKMRYGRFLAFNVIGGLAWVCLFLFAGYFFGNIPFVQKNLTPIIYGIVALSLVPAICGAIAGRRREA